jgi:hypothetical protein
MKLHPARGVVDAGLRPPRVKITETERRVLTVDNATSDPEAQSRVTALETALRELGWVKGRNLSIEYRWPGEWKHRAQPCKQGSRSVGQHAWSSPPVSVLTRGRRRSVRATVRHGFDVAAMAWVCVSRSRHLRRDRRAAIAMTLGTWTTFAAARIVPTREFFPIAR